jgi:hypothetical protein
MYVSSKSTEAILNEIRDEWPAFSGYYNVTSKAEAYPCGSPYCAYFRGRLLPLHALKPVRKTL